MAMTLFATACARGVAVQSEPGPAYALQVNNPMPHPMIVWYDDGTGSHLLGTVSAGTQGRFVITRPARQDITVTATDEARTHTISRAVTLQPGVTAEVSLTS
jgi:hypothetical protein